MTASTLSIGRRGRTPTRSTQKRLVALGLAAALIGGLVFANSQANGGSDGLVATKAPAAETPAAEAAAKTVAIEINGFEVFAEVPHAWVAAGSDQVDIRSLPGTSSPIVGLMEPGDAILSWGTGQAATNGEEIWIELEYDGLTGWVRSDLLAATDAN